MNDPYLSVEGLEVHYGKTVALSGVDLEVGRGEAVAVLGPNGAGKTTLADAISGVVRLSAGRISFDGQDLAKVKPYKIARGGVLQVPEGRGVLRDLTVRENLVLGGLTAVRRKDSGDRSITRVLERFPRLEERLGQSAGSLSGGEQQMLVLARAMIAQPKLLILDEPSLGLAPQLVRDTFDLLATLKADGLSMLVIEQNFPMSLKLADRAYVLASGKVVISGSADHVRNHPELVTAYLGVDAVDSATPAT
jgi:branched-chain amino acid transport system ATP-binding protein